jgi:DNA-binding transcriptional regulator YdaS (Cro superfamily)
VTPEQYKRRRAKLGTQVAVAKRLGVHPVTIAKRETGAMVITTEAAAALRQLSKPKK